MKDDQLLNAFTIWQSLSQSPEDYLAYQSRFKYILDEEAKIEDIKHFAQREGLVMGMEQGEKRNREKLL